MNRRWLVAKAAETNGRYAADSRHPDYTAIPIAI